jgi:hypothetical protein
MLYPLFIVWLMSSCLWLAAAAGLLLARSRGYREASLACVLLAPICLVLGRASEAYWGWVALSFTVAILWWFGGWLFRRKDLQDQDRNHSSMRFSIRILLGLTAAIGWILFVVARTQRLDSVAWRSVFAISLVFALMAVLIELIHYSTKSLSVVKRWLIRASTPLFIGLVFPLVMFDDLLPAFLESSCEWPPSPAMAMFSFGNTGRARVWWFAIGSLFALKILLIPSPSLWSLHSTKHRGLSAAILIVIAAIPLWVGIQLTQIPQKDFVDSDRAAAYNELVSVCNECERSIYASTIAKYSEWDKVPSAEKQIVLEQTGTLLDALNEALERPIRIPLDYSMNDIAVLPVISFRSCARLVNSHAESKVIINPDDALETFLLSEKMGAKLQQGGLFLHALVGIASAGDANRGMKVHIASFSSAARERAALEIMKNLNEIDTIETLTARDRNWSNNQSWVTHVQNLVQGRLGIGVIQGTYSIDVVVSRYITDRRLMVLELLLQNYHDDKGIYPESLDEVVAPSYREIASDPFSKNGAPFIYRIEDGNFLLYSLGDNGVDDGGEYKPDRVNFYGKDQSLARHLLPAEKEDFTFDGEISEDGESFPMLDVENENAETSEPEKANP